VHAYRADSPEREVQAFDAFPDLLDGRDDFALFHHGTCL
jgi:hypothetical protein